jgi:hypothetical protein
VEKLCTCLLFGVLVVNEVGVEGRGGGGGGGAVLCCITAHHRIPVEG